MYKNWSILKRMVPLMQPNSRPYIAYGSIFKSRVIGGDAIHWAQFRLDYLAKSIEGIRKSCTDYLFEINKILDLV